MQSNPKIAAAPKRGSNALYSLLLGTLLAVAGCGGGGGGSPAAPGGDGTLPVVNNGFTNNDPSDLASLLASYSAGDVGGSSGTGSSSGDSGADGSAGDGGAIRRAAVVMTCSNSATQYRGTTDDTGKYLIRFNRADCLSPYLIRVVDVGGNIYSSIGVDTPVLGKVVRINITPLTDKVVSDVVQPLGLGATSQNFTAQSITAKLSGEPLTTAVTKAKTDLRTSINDALAVSGITAVNTFDPVVSTHAFNGTGVDAVLESISHTRAPQTGRTVLSAKLVSIGSSATPTIAEITAATPLAVAQLNSPTSPALNFSKLDAWLTQVNFCLASVPGSVTAAICDANVIANTYKHNSMDFRENFRTLISNASCGTQPAPCHIRNSTLRNPLLLFTGKFAGSTASYDDLAVVEVTINQPSVGNYYTGSAVATPVEYTKVLVFKRDDAAIGLTAGNWVLHGNQRNFDLSVSPRYDKFTQANPARDSNAVPTPTTTVTASISGNPFVTTSVPGFTYTNVIGTQTVTVSGINLNDPSVYMSRLRFFVNPLKFNTNSRQWESANIQAVKVTGPGLPSAGLVMMSNATAVCGGDDYLSIANATGSMPTGTGTVFNNASYSGNSYVLASVLQNDLSQEAFYQSATRADRRTGNLTDFSALTAYNLYQFDVRLIDGTQTTEFARTLAPVNPPALLASAQWHDMSPSAALLSPTALASTATDYTVSWINNSLAAYVNNAQIFTSVSARNATGGIINPSWTHSRGVTAGSALVRPTSQSLGYPADPSCLGGAQYPAIAAIRDQRQFTARSYQGRADMYNTLGYRK